MVDVVVNVVVVEIEIDRERRPLVRCFRADYVHGYVYDYGPELLVTEPV